MNLLWERALMNELIYLHYYHTFITVLINYLSSITFLYNHLSTWFGYLNSWDPAEVWYSHIIRSYIKRGEEKHNRSVFDVQNICYNLKNERHRAFRYFSNFFVEVSGAVINSVLFKSSRVSGFQREFLQVVSRGFISIQPKNFSKFLGIIRVPT